MATGELAKARLLLDDPDVLAKDPTFYGLLGLIMIEQKDLAQVENVIIPKMHKLLKGNDQYYTQVLEGRLLSLKGKPFAKQARACFLRAIAYRPDMDQLADIILGLDVVLEDASSAELHAIQALRRRVDDPYANYILGTFRLNEMKFGDAELYLERAAKAKAPRFEALNNYAEALLHVGKPAEAEAFARQAVKAKPADGAVWSLLADACIRVKKLDEAKHALGQARDFNANKDPRYAFVEARLALAEGRVADAKGLIGPLAQAKLSKLERRDLTVLSGEIAQATLH